MTRLIIGAGVLAILTATGSAQQTPLVNLLDAYFQGHRDDAVRRPRRLRISVRCVRFVQDVPVWVRADPAMVDQRRAAAAAFLLELAHARLETDWGRLADLIEFTCADLRTANANRSFELAWHRAIPR